MRKQMFLLSILLMTFIFFAGCTQGNENSQTGEKKNVSESSDTKVTFIELGSVDCTPCKMMQPVMKSIEKKYGDQVNVIFYDVWTKEEAKYAKFYNINGIPTQVFLDSEGNEFYRHVGFFPEKEIDALLQKRGLKPVN